MGGFLGENFPMEAPISSLNFSQIESQCLACFNSILHFPKKVRGVEGEYYIYVHSI